MSGKDQIVEANDLMLLAPAAGVYLIEGRVVIMASRLLGRINWGNCWWRVIRGGCEEVI